MPYMLPLLAMEYSQYERNFPMNLGVGVVSEQHGNDYLVASPLTYFEYHAS